MIRYLSDSHPWIKRGQEMKLAGKKVIIAIQEPEHRWIGIRSSDYLVFADLDPTPDVPSVIAEFIRLLSEQPSTRRNKAGPSARAVKSTAT